MKRRSLAAMAVAIGLVFSGLFTGTATAYSDRTPVGPCKHYRFVTAMDTYTRMPSTLPYAGTCNCWLNISLRYQENPGVKQLQISLPHYNGFDRKYWIAADGHYGPATRQVVMLTETTINREKGYERHKVDGQYDVNLGQQMHWIMNDYRSTAGSITVLAP